jgi:hypothetical protein
MLLRITTQLFIAHPLTTGHRRHPALPKNRGPHHLIQINLHVISWPILKNLTGDIPPERKYRVGVVRIGLESFTVLSEAPFKLISFAKKALYSCFLIFCQKIFRPRGPPSLPAGISRPRVWTTQRKKSALIAVQGKVQHSKALTLISGIVLTYSKYGQYPTLSDVRGYGIFLTVGNDRVGKHKMNTGTYITTLHC